MPFLSHSVCSRVRSTIVRTHSSGKGKHGAFFAAEPRRTGFHRQGIRNGTLEGGGDIGLIQNFPLLLRIMEQVDNGRFDSRKTEIIAFALVKRCMEAECIRVPAFCKLLYLRPPGYGKPSARAALSKASPAASSRVLPISSKRL